MRSANDIAERIHYHQEKLAVIMHEKQTAIMMLDWAEVSHLAELEIRHRAQLDVLAWVLQQIVFAPRPEPRMVQISMTDH